MRCTMCNMFLDGRSILLREPKRFGDVCSARSLRHGADRLWDSPAILMFAASFFWALNPIVGRAARELISPISLAFWRWSVAFLILAPFAMKHMARDLPVIRQSWQRLFMLGIIGVGVFSYLVYWSLQYTTATNNLLLQSVMPILMIMLPSLFFGDAITMRSLACALLSLIGIVLIVTKGDPGGFSWGAINRGDLAALAAVFLYAIYGTLLRRTPPMHHLSLLGVLFAVGMLCLGIPYGIELVRSPPLELPSSSAVLAVLYVGIFPSLIAYALFNRTVALIGVARTGPYLNLPPVIGVMMAVPLLGEALHRYHFVGAALVFVAIAYANWHRTNAAAADAAGQTRD